MFSHCDSFFLHSELKRRQKQEKKEREKAEKAAAGQEQQTPKKEKENEEEIDPNVRIFWGREALGYALTLVMLNKLRCHTHF